MTWLCANCGARHEENSPPCKQCAHEQFAELVENDTPDELESSADVHWRCKECGINHVKNSPPCKNCGHMQFEAIRASDQTAESGEDFEVPEDDLDEPTQTRITGMTLVIYLIGVATVLAGVLWILGGDILFGIPVVISGCITLPYSRRWLEQKHNLELSQGAIVVQYVLGWTVGLFLYNLF